MKLNLLQLVSGTTASNGNLPASPGDQNGFASLLGQLGTSFAEAQGNTQIKEDTKTSTDFVNSLPGKFENYPANKSSAPKKHADALQLPALPLVLPVAISAQIKNQNASLPVAETNNNQSDVSEVVSGNSPISQGYQARESAPIMGAPDNLPFANQASPFTIEDGDAPSLNPSARVRVPNIGTIKPTLNVAQFANATSVNADKILVAPSSNGANQLQNSSIDSASIDPASITPNRTATNLAEIKAFPTSAIQERINSPKITGKSFDTRATKANAKPTSTSHKNRNSTDLSSQFLKTNSPQTLAERNSSFSADSGNQSSEDSNLSEHFATTLHSKSEKFADDLAKKDVANQSFSPSDVRIDPHSLSVSSVSAIATTSTPDTNAQINTAPTSKNSQPGMPRPMPQMQDAPPPQNMSHSDVQVARIADRAGQAEMHIGMRMPAFGSVEVHTVVHQNQVGVAVGSEHGDIKTFLSAEIPALRNNLNQQDLQFSNIDFHNLGQSAYQFHGGADSHSNRQQPQQQQRVPFPNYFQTGNPHDEDAPTPQLHTSSLNIRA